MIKKIFDGVMFIRTLPITLLIFCKIILNSKNIMVPDDHMMQKTLKMTETLAHGYSSESTEARAFQ